MSYDPGNYMVQWERAEKAEARIKDLEVFISTAIGAAIHDSKPCPMCGGAFVSHVWPYHEHMAHCDQLTKRATRFAGTEKKT